MCENMCAYINCGYMRDYFILYPKKNPDNLLPIIIGIESDNVPYK